VRAIQSSAPFRLAVVDGMDVRKARPSAGRQHRLGLNACKMGGESPAHHPCQGDDAKHSAALHRS
jgi:hypothetical protein